MHRENKIAKYMSIWETVNGCSKLNTHTQQGDVVVVMSSRNQKRVGNKCSVVTYEILQKGNFNLNVKKKPENGKS